MTDHSIFARFRATAARWPSKPFLNILPETAAVYGIEAGEISYADMLARALKRSEALAAAGYGEGTRIGLLLHNRPEFLEMLLAANRLGASIVPINPDLRRSELEYLIAHSEMAAAFVLPDRLAEMSAAALAAGSAMVPVTLDGPVPSLPAPALPAAADDADREAALLYTSGTTGSPKGCVLTNEYFLHSGDWYRGAGGLMSLREGEERMLTPLPVSVMAQASINGKPKRSSKGA